MNLFDIRTILFSYVITNAICLSVVLALWWHNRLRAAGVNFWLADFGAQFVAVFLIALRGIVPAWASEFFGAPLILAGTLLLLIGLERYIGKTRAHVFNWLIVGAFTLLHAYFVFAQPSLQARNLVFSAGRLILCAQCAWLLARRADAAWLPSTRPVGAIFGLYGVVSIARFIADWQSPPNNDLLQIGWFDTLTILAYQMLFIALTFGLFWLVNRRLRADLVRDMAERHRAEAALRVDQANITALIENTDSSIWSVDVNYRLIIGNSTFHRDVRAALGRELAPGESVLHEHFPRAALEEWRGHYDRALRGEIFALETETRFRAAPRNIEYRFHPIHADDGQIVGATVLGRDITARKRAQAALADAESNAKLELLFDILPVGVSILDRDRRIVKQNRALEKIMDLSKEGLARGDYRARTYLRADGTPMPPEEFASARVMRGEPSALNVETGIIKEDGTTIWVNVSAVAGPFADWNTILVTADINDRVRAEQALRASEVLMRTIAENYPNSYISIIEKDLTIGFTSGQEFKKQNLDPHQFVGLPLEPVFGEHAPFVREKYLETFGGAETQFELFINAQHQLYRTVPLRDSNGDIQQILVVVENITERKRAEEHLLQRTAQLAALHEIDLAISNTFDLRITLDILLRQVVAQLQVDAATVLLVNPHLHLLEYAAGFGFRYPTIQKSRVHLGEGCAGRAALERQIISGTIGAPDRADCQRLRVELADENFVTHHIAPLIVKGQVKGVLEIFQRTRREPANEWLDFFQVLAGQAAIGVDSALLFEGLQRSNAELALSYDATLEGWSRALDLRDQETEGHSQRVTEMAVRLARAMGMNDAELVHVRRGALLHDIGKLGVPDSILFKPGALTDAEWQVMRRHPKLAFDLIAPIVFLRPALDIPYCHHEKWDGSGYPRRLRGEHIPLAARVFAVVDVWDALRSNRAYRQAWSAEQTRAYLREQADKHFDPRVVHAFLELVADVG